MEQDKKNSDPTWWELSGNLTPKLILTRMKGIMNLFLTLGPLFDVSVIFMLVGSILMYMNKPIIFADGYVDDFTNFMIAGQFLVTFGAILYFLQLITYVFSIISFNKYLKRTLNEVFIKNSWEYFAIFALAFIYVWIFYKRLRKIFIVKEGMWKDIIKKQDAASIFSIENPNFQNFLESLKEKKDFSTNTLSPDNKQTETYKTDNSKNNKEKE